MQTLFNRDNHVVAHNVCQFSEPKPWKKALTSDYAKEWKLVADSECKSFMENETWELVELPCGRKVIHCKWILKVKHGSDDSV